MQIIPNMAEITGWWFFWCSHFTIGGFRPSSGPSMAFVGARLLLPEHSERKRSWPLGYTTYCVYIIFRMRPFWTWCPVFLRMPVFHKASVCVQPPSHRIHDPMTQKGWLVILSKACRKWKNVKVQWSISTEPGSRGSLGIPWIPLCHGFHPCRLI